MLLAHLKDLLHLRPCRLDTFPDQIAFERAQAIREGDVKRVTLHDGPVGALSDASSPSRKRMTSVLLFRYKYE